MHLGLVIYGSLDTVSGGYLYDRKLVENILRAVDTNEFKRRQAAPTIRVSEKAFGSGRQMPIAQRWRREPARFVK